MQCKKKNGYKIVLLYLFIMEIAYWCIASMFSFEGIWDNFKYILLFISMALEIVYFVGKIKIIKFHDKLIEGIMLVFLFFMLSWTCIVVTEQSWNVRTFKELFYLLIPIFHAFLLFNILSKKEIIYLVKRVLLVSLALYFVQLMTKGMNFSDIKNISFANSYSPFESSLFADLSVVCFCFFAYLKSIGYARKDMFAKVYYYVSFFFVILTFKRVLILFATCLFLLDLFKLTRCKINRFVYYLIPAVIIIGTMVYTWLLQGENAELLNKWFSIDLDKLTVGRKWYLSLIENSGFISFGYGSTTVRLSGILEKSKYLEMDLVKIYLEIGPIALMSFVIYYWSYTAKKLLPVVIMTFLMLNMLVSHSLTTYYPWCIFLMIFYYCKQDNDEGTSMPMDKVGAFTKRKRTRR